MKTPRRSRQTPTNPVKDHHGRRGWRPSMGHLTIALGLTAVGLYLLLSSDEAGTAATAKAAQSSSRDKFATWTPPALPSSMSAQNDAPPKAEANAAANAERDADPTRDLSFYLARGEKPTMAEVIERLHQAGVHTGLGAFSPPGTRPPLVGLAVPEDFELPPGYVRHHQATDDGQPIEAILMYAPDYQFVDATNQPIAIPKDRVVPPEHAPPGLPIRRIVIPAPIDTQ